MPTSGFYAVRTVLLFAPLLLLCNACTNRTDPPPKGTSAAKPAAAKPPAFKVEEPAAKSPFAPLNVEVGMKRMTIEQFVAKLQERKCTYRTWGNNLRGGSALYLHDGWSLRVTYKRGQVGEMDADAKGKIIGHTPAIDETVTEFSVEKGPPIADSVRTAINPKDSTWLSPQPGGGMMGCWDSVVVPERFYFKRDELTICTDHNGKVLWEQKYEGRPLWDFQYHLRAMITRDKDSKKATIRWVAKKDGQSTVSVAVHDPQASWDGAVFLGKDDGDFAYRRGVGFHIPGQPPLFTKSELSFFRKGKLVSTWDPAKGGYRLLAPIGRRKDGCYLVIGEKDNKGKGRAYDKDGQRLLFVFNADGTLTGKLSATAFDVKLPMFAGAFTRGIKGHGYQIHVRKDLFITKDPMQPNRFTADASAITMDRSGHKRVPFTLLWRLPLHEEIWDLTNDQDGAFYVLTSRHVDRRGFWSVAKVSVAERKVTAITQLGFAGHDVMGFGNTIYAYDLEKEGNTVSRILWRHQIQ